MPTPRCEPLRLKLSGRIVAKRGDEMSRPIGLRMALAICRS